MKLPERERAALATSLLQSLDPEVDEQAEELWERELAGRLAEIDSGAVTLLTWKEAQRRLGSQLV